MSEHDFQSSVLQILADVQTKAAVTASTVDRIEEHLLELNGKVARHEKELNERRNWCPMIEALGARVRQTEDYITSIEAALREGTTWKDHLRPVAYTAVSTFIVLVVFLSLIHSET